MNSIAFSPDGMRIVSGGEDGTLRLWNVVDHKWTATFTGHKGRISGVAFSPDASRIVSGGDDGTLRLWKPRATDRSAATSSR